MKYLVIVVVAVGLATAIMFGMPTTTAQTLCVDILKLQTQLPLSRYSLINAENSVGIARDGNSRFLLYPLAPGLQVAQEIPYLTEVFSINGGKWVVFRSDDPELATETIDKEDFSYYVQAPLPFRVLRMDRTATRADIETFIRGLVSVVECDQKNVAYREEIDSR